MVERTKVLHIISNLNRGGAEAMLQKVVRTSSEMNVENAIISMIEGGQIADELKQAGVQVNTLGGARSFATMSHFGALRRMIRNLKPDLLQAWMYHANIAASLYSIFNSDRRVPVIWNVRQSAPTLRNESLVTAAAILTGAPLSRQPHSIIYNSHRAADDHERLHYSRSRRIIIPNGFDTGLFQPSSARRAELVRELGLPDDAVLIGRVANFHAHKDFQTLFAAFSRLSQANERAHLVLVGRGLNSSNSEFAKLMASLPLPSRVRVMGERSDIANIMPGFDALVSSSSAEAFPNVIGEAMSSGVPTVTTDAGDCADVLGDPARVVPCRSAEMLAEKLENLISLDTAIRADIGRRDRERIMAHYSIDAVTEQYVSLWRQTILGRSDQLPE